MNALDYFNNPKVTEWINRFTSKIKNAEDHQDCVQDIWAELYDFKPYEEEDIKSLIRRVVRKCERKISKIQDNETDFETMTPAL